MKTICFVVPNFPVVSETFIVNQIVALKEKGYKVFVLTHQLGLLNQSSQQDLINEHSILENVVSVDYKIPSSSIKRFFIGLFYSLKYFKHWIKISDRSIRYRLINSPYLLKFYSKFKDVDVFHVQFAMSGMGIVEMKDCGLLQGKLITTFHGHDAHSSNTNELKKLRDRYKLLFDTSDYVTVNTTYLKSKVVTLGCDESKVEIIPMGINLEKFKDKNPKQLRSDTTFKLISVGRLITLKGFSYAIEAVKILVDQGVKIEYTIVGNGSDYSRLQKQIKSLNLVKEVKLIGDQSQDKIRDLLKMHHAYAMCSITDDSGRSEAQGLVTAEAQAMNLPVVAFNSGGVPDTVVHNSTGFLVQEKDVNNFAEAILKLINNPENYKQMSVKAREFVVASFSKELMLMRFISLYEE